MKGVARESLEDNIIQSVQADITNWIDALGAKYKRRPPKGTGLTGSGAELPQGGSNVSVLGYSLKWNDPDNRRNHLFFGATAGTPALLNLNAGFWGSTQFPLVASVSGMYYGNSQRGVQLDVGVAIVNSGTLRQAVGLALVGVNETTTNTTSNYDAFDRPTQTNIETINAIEFYSGPVYTLDWKSFRLQVGGGYKVSDGAQSNVRFFFQLGYTPPLDL